MRESRAQATLEYALVLFAFLVMVAAIAAMWRAGAEGVFTSLASPCGWMRESRAQATLEYALVLFAFLVMVAAIAAMWRAGAEGVFTSLASRAASHALDLGGAVDISLY